jgi:hypothetical protein
VSDTERLRRRFTIMLSVYLAVFLGAIVLVFTLTGFARWLILLVAVCNVVVYWELRRALPPAV